MTRPSLAYRYLLANESRENLDGNEIRRFQIGCNDNQEIDKSMVNMKVRNIPDAPEVLDDDEYWNYYCQQLQDEGRLYKKDLSAIKTLCFWEEERDKLLELIKEEGLTEKAGSKIRRNGAHTTIEKVEKSIKSLRKELDVAPHWSAESKSKKGSVDTDPPPRDY